MTAKEINKIFDRFYQVDESRKSEWFWIGLSLVKKITDIYWWKMKVISKYWKGSEFSIYLK
jgi:signal transduction histidine kinase